MVEKIEKKIRSIFICWRTGNRKDAAKKIRALSKVELFYLVSSNKVTALPELISLDRNTVGCFENFIGNSLEGNNF